MSILVVDDNQDELSLVERILKNAGYTDIFLAKRASEAFDILKINKTLDACLEKPQVDIILMDIVMPVMDGLDAVSVIKKFEQMRYIPVVMVTALNDMGDLQTAFARGATDYIEKPFHKTELLARVRSALKLKYETDQRIARESELVELTKQLESANKMLRNLSYLDSLTDIPNRRYFDDLLQVEWNRTMRSSSPLSLIMVDIDHFKFFNDAYGHQAGDRCLQKIAKVLYASVKRPGDFVARYGGEEFIAVLPEIDKEDACHIAERMRLDVIALAIPHAASPVVNLVTISLGVASMIPTNNSSPRNLIEMADKALYKAKQEGRNKAVAF